MKKLAYLIVAATCLLGTVACSDNDDLSASAEQLQGTWAFYEAHGRVDGYSFSFNAEELRKISKEFGLTFWDDTFTFSGNKVNGVEYKIDGNRLIMSSYGDISSEQLSGTITELTGTDLVLHYDLSAYVDMFYIS